MDPSCTVGVAVAPTAVPALLALGGRDPCQFQHKEPVAVGGAGVHPEILPAGQQLSLPAARKEAQIRRRGPGDAAPRTPQLENGGGGPPRRTPREPLT